MAKKIAIVGWSATRNLAPYDNEEWDIWVMNQNTMKYPRHTLHFDLHNTLVMTDYYYDYIINNKEKSILTGADTRFSEATVYPKDAIIEKYGDFFTNSMSWMIAYAIEQNPTDIGIWGVDCMAKEEYVDQRPSIMFLLGIAKGKGINLHFPSGCKLFRKNKLYWNN
jgi:hypothetical protein